MHSLITRHIEQLVYRCPKHPSIDTLAEAIMAIRARAPLGREQHTTGHMHPDDARALLTDALERDSLLLRADDTVWLLGAELHTDTTITPGTFEIRAHLIKQERPCLP